MDRIQLVIHVDWTRVINTKTGTNKRCIEPLGMSSELVWMSASLAHTASVTAIFQMTVYQIQTRLQKDYEPLCKGLLQNLAYIWIRLDLCVFVNERTCRPMGPGGPGKPRAPSSPFCPNIPCWPLGPGSPSPPWAKNGVIYLFCHFFVNYCCSSIIKHMVNNACTLSIHINNTL